MTKEYSSVSLPKELAEKLNTKNEKENLGYSSTGEYVRDLIRKETK